MEVDQPKALDSLPPIEQEALQTLRLSGEQSARVARAIVEQMAFNPDFRRVLLVGSSESITWEPGGAVVDFPALQREAQRLRTRARLVEQMQPALTWGEAALVRLADQGLLDDKTADIAYSREAEKERELEKLRAQVAVEMAKFASQFRVKITDESCKASRGLSAEHQEMLRRAVDSLPTVSLKDKPALPPQTPVLQGNVAVAAVVGAQILPRGVKAALVTLSATTILSGCACHNLFSPSPEIPPEVSTSQTSSDQIPDTGGGGDGFVPGPTETPPATPEEAQAIAEFMFKNDLNVLYLEGDTIGLEQAKQMTDINRSNPQWLANLLAVTVTGEPAIRAGVNPAEVGFFMAGSEGLVAYYLKDGQLVSYRFGRTEQVLAEKGASWAEEIVLNNGLGEKLFKIGNDYFVPTGRVDAFGQVKEIVSCDNNGNILKLATLRNVVVFRSVNMAQGGKEGKVLLVDAVPFKLPDGTTLRKGVTRQLASNGMWLSVNGQKVLWNCFKGTFEGNPDFLWKLPEKPTPTKEAGFSREFGFYQPEWYMSEEVMVDGIKMEITIGLTRSVTDRTVEPVKALVPAREDSFERIARYHLQMCWLNYKKNNPGNDGLSFEQYEELVRQGGGEITLVAF